MCLFTCSTCTLPIIAAAYTAVELELPLPPPFIQHPSQDPDLFFLCSVLVVALSTPHTGTGAGTGSALYVYISISISISNVSVALGFSSLQVGFGFRKKRRL
jgi:hypothetical protein